jgi:hypothetical protein
MEQDFSPPIKELFQGPTANLERATREARSVMAEGVHGFGRRQVRRQNVNL